MWLVEFFGSLSKQLKLLVCLAVMIFVAIPALYLMFVTLPVGLTAIASGRGVTAWGLEISPNKACEHAHQILADSAVNNEIALYGKLAAAFLKNSDDILDKKIEGQGSEVTPRNKELFARMAEAQEAMGRMADARVAMFQAINDGCLKRMSDSEAAISWQTAFLAFGYALLLFFFANTIVKALFKIGRE